MRRYRGYSMKQTPELLIHSRTSSPHRLKTLNSLLHRLHTVLRYSRLHHHPSPWPQKTLYRQHSKGSNNGIMHQRSDIYFMRMQIKERHRHQSFQCPTQHITSWTPQIIPSTLLTPKSPPPPRPHHTTHKSHTPHTDYAASLNQPISLIHSIDTLTHTSRTP
jgi:hypothetical protein